MRAKKALVVIAGIFLLLVGSTLGMHYRDTLARIVWEHYGNAYVTFVLVSEDLDLAMQLGNYYFGGGAYDLKKAEWVYQKAVAIDPTVLWGHYQLARIAFVNGDFKTALQEIEKELKGNPENLRSLYMRGLIYGYRGHPGDLVRAADDFKRFTLWAPSEWAGYNDLAWILLKDKRNADARDALLLAFEQVSDAEKNPWLWNSLGVAYLNLGSKKEAARAFDTASALANNLSLNEWRETYPGNDPASAEDGLRQFKQAINVNQEKVKRLSD